MKLKQRIFVKVENKTETYPPYVGPCCRLALLASTSAGVNRFKAASSSVAPGTPGTPFCGPPLREKELG